MQIRQIFKALNKTIEGKIKLREILSRARYKLEEREYWALHYAYLEKLSAENISNKLNLSESHYFNVLKNALSKIEIFIDDREMRELIKLI